MEDCCDPCVDGDRHVLARLVYKAPMVQTRVGERGIELVADAEMPKTPPFIYAGIRG